MCFSEYIQHYLPAWIVFLLGSIAFLQFAYITIRYEATVLSRMERALFVIALFNFALFYFLRWQNLLEIQNAISFSRINQIWLSTVFIYVGYQMQVRQKKN